VRIGVRRWVQYNLFDAVRDKIVLLMQFDENRDAAAAEARLLAPSPTATATATHTTSAATPTNTAAEEEAHPAATLLIKNTDKIPVCLRLRPARASI
jgi:hypothetical protein